MMNPYDDNEDNDIEELAEQFKQAESCGTPLFFDEDDYQDVIGLLLESGEMEYAQKAIQRAISEFPEEPYFRIQYAKYYALMMNYKEAQRELNYLEANFTPIPEFYIEKVLISHAFNQKVNGIELLNKALDLDENIPEAHLLLTHEYLSDNDIEKAVHHAVRAIQLDVLAAEDLKIVTIDFQGFFAPSNGPLEEFYTRMTEELPMCGSLWSGLGLVYMNRHEFDRAIEAFQFQLSLDEDDSLSYVNLAEAYLASGDYENALGNFKIAQDKSEILRFDVQLGRCYFYMGDYDQAMCHFLQAKQDDPLYAFVISDIVRVFKAQGKYDEARAYLRDQLNKDPHNIDAIEELIDLLNPQKHVEEIKDLCFAALHTENCSKYSFLNYFVFYCCHTDGADLGIEICSEYEYDPDLCTNVSYFLAALYLKKGQIQKGCEYLEIALQADPNLCFSDFEEMDPELKTIPEVAELLTLYKDEDRDAHDLTKFFN